MSQIINSKAGLKPRAIVFYIAVAVTVTCMFFSWFALDLNLGYVDLGDMVGAINVFTLPGALTEIRDAISPVASLLPDDFTRGLGVAVVFGYTAMILGIGAIVCFALAVAHRVNNKENVVKLCGMATVATLLAAVIFTVLVCVIVTKLAGDMFTFYALGRVLGSPCALSIFGALVAIITAGEGEEWVRHYTERIDTTIEEHPHDPATEWVCSSCMTVNKTEQKFCKCGCGVGLK